MSINILNMDCIEGMRNLPAESVDLIITSPPYNIGKDYGTYKDNRSWSDYWLWTNRWLEEATRVLAPTGRICINCLLSLNMKGAEQQPIVDFCNKLLYEGLGIHSIAFWTDVTRKKLTCWGSWKSASAPYVYNPYEAIIIGYKDQWKKKEKGKSTISTKEFKEACSGVWKLGTAHGNSSFPLALPLRCIHLLSYEGAMVLDPFSGSGTTAVACAQTNRSFIGFEIDPDLVTLAKKKVKEEQSAVSDGTPERVV